MTVMPDCASPCVDSTTLKLCFCDTMPMASSCSGNSSSTVDVARYCQPVLPASAGCSVWYRQESDHQPSRLKPAMITVSGNLRREGAAHGNQRARVAHHMYRVSGDMHMQQTRQERVHR